MSRRPAADGVPRSALSVPRSLPLHDDRTSGLASGAGWGTLNAQRGTRNGGASRPPYAARGFIA